ncbi:hypothetical protein POJ06DRAFT_198697 [Lipomyces tetrasporus]|uniref:Zn(2)-C6 fungal-type domain-containing protein n=1 Tax=Lipomyces tetrasporus TaxID=54092 RepID=A0AAD7QPB5_9ASCO|nr:uncharacterized protein POJ06DRAFT_198697 [Lipomyces tetrasporus]KAJ8099013.1 hypothetical protein POJ06DRAFT_198697 [Lipomyces tetrasporus]
MSSSSNPHYDRACDQCWSRKVKCGRSLPCPRCRNLSLDCSYIRPRKKKGPSGKRIGLIRLRSAIVPAEAVSVTRTPITESIDDESTLALALSPSSLCCVSPSDTDAPSITTGMTANEMLLRSDLLQSLFTDFSADSGLLLINQEHELTPIVQKSFNVDSSTMDSLVRTYTWRMSKYYPLVDTASLLARLGARENAKNLEFGALVFSICAFVLLQPVFKRDVLQDKTTLQERNHLAQTLMDDAIAMRNMDPVFMERPSIDSILTSFFLFACLVNRQLPHAAWLRLREAVTLAEIMEMQSLDNVTITVDEREKRATLYRILAVTEHAYAVQRRYALSRNLLSRLQRSAFSALYPSCLSATYGVTKLVSLFSIISVDILDCWNEKCGARSPDGCCTKFTTERALEMHRFISEVYNDKPNSDSLLSEPQIADIMISQQWLHNRLWNVCHTHDLLNEEDTAESCREMSITYAIDIARDTIQISKKFTMENLEVHGIGIIGKLYDIATSAIMLVSCYPSLRKRRIEDCKVVPSDMEVLNQFVALLAMFGGGQHPYLVPLMMAIAGIPPLG